MEGWIKLHRKLRDHPRAKDPEWFSLWVHILLKASHTSVKCEFDGKVVELKPGQFITGRFALAEESGLHESKVYRTLVLLEIEQQIAIVRGAKGSIITVLNWRSYQSIDPPPNSYRTANEQPVNTHERMEEGKKYPPQGEIASVNHPDFAAVLAWVVKHMNAKRPAAEQFTRDECWRAWLDFEGGRDSDGNWYQFSHQTRKVGHWPSAFEDRLLHNRERKQHANNRRSSNSGYKPQTNLNTGKTSQYRGVGKVGSVSNEGG